MKKCYSVIVIATLVLMSFSSIVYAVPAKSVESYYADKNYWSNFDWKNVYKSDVFKKLKWKSADQSALDLMNNKVNEKSDNPIKLTNLVIKKFTIDTAINRVAVKAKITEFESKDGKNKIHIRYDNDSASKEQSDNIFKWCTSKYGDKYVMSIDNVVSTKDISIKMTRYQWETNNSVLSYSILLTTAGNTIMNNNLTIGLDITDKSNVELRKPYIILSCSSITKTGESESKNDNIFIIEDSVTPKAVKNEKYKRTIITSTVLENAIELRTKSKEYQVEYDISRLTGKMTGKFKFPDGYSSNITGQCVKLDKLEPIF